MPAVIDDTYAEAFRSIYVEFLLTAATGDGSNMPQSRLTLWCSSI